MKLYKSVCLSILLVAFMSCIYAEWDPECLATENEQLLANPNLVKLENQVFEQVKNSWCSKEKAQLLIELVVLTKPKVCVEIGAFTGSSTLPMLAGLQYVKHGYAYVIDAWSAKEATAGLPSSDSHTQWWANQHMKTAKKMFEQMLDQWSFRSYCQVLPMASRKAVGIMAGIDFLHLDGNFSEAGALLDSELYVPKVLPGGYILLSNALTMVDGKPSKMKALWIVFDQCDIIAELDAGNTLLFRKK